MPRPTAPAAAAERRRNSRLEVGMNEARIRETWGKTRWNMKRGTGSVQRPVPPCVRNLFVSAPGALEGYAFRSWQSFPDGMFGLFSSACGTGMLTSLP
jgi:hypothetical protein